MKKLVVATLIMMMPSFAAAKTLGTVGQTYPFAERDALAEVMERVARVNWKKAMAGLRRSENALMNLQLDVPRATRDRVKTVDVSYTLEVDVPNPKNPSQVLYPKGWSFNPLQYMTIPGSTIFINAGDKAQRDWLLSSPYAADRAARILLTGGDLPQMEKALKRAVYFADGVLIDRFGITAVPSVAIQKGVSFEVHEIKVHSRP